jgi:hypothetical protein
MYLSGSLPFLCHGLLLMPSFCFVGMPCRYHATTRLFNDKNDMDLTGFNPFQYQSRGNRAYSMSGTQISLRKTGMQQLIATLLQAPTENIQDILENHKDFLLEPLEDMDAVLDPDSIYRGDMTRSQRYQSYRESMHERVDKARDPKAHEVLEAMMDFVLRFE